MTLGMLFSLYGLLALLAILAASFLVRAFLKEVLDRPVSLGVVYLTLVLIAGIAIGLQLTWVRHQDTAAFEALCREIQINGTSRMKHDRRIVVRGVTILGIPQVVADQFVEVQREAEVGGRAWRKVNSDACQPPAYQTVRGHCFARAEVNDVAELMLLMTSSSTPVSSIHRVQSTEWIVQNPAQTQTWTQLSLWAVGSDGPREGIFSTRFCKSGSGDRHTWLSEVLGADPSLTAQVD